MGLDVSHDCWRGAYSAFMRWRAKLCEVAGLGDIMQREGFGGECRPWPDPEKVPLVWLLSHADNEGEIPVEQCGPIADALEALMPALRLAGDGGGHIGDYAEKTQRFIDGLRMASSLGETVEFS